MKRNLLLTLYAILLAFILTACTSGPVNGPITTHTLNPSAGNGQSEPAASPSSNETGTAGKAAVSIENFAFNPASLTISAGTTVVWTNNDSAGHDVKSPDFTSPMMAKGQTYEYKFDKAGTYEYICGVHPAMKGTIVVK